MQIFITSTRTRTDWWEKDIRGLVQLLVALYSVFQEILGLLFRLLPIRGTEYGIEYPIFPISREHIHKRNSFIVQPKMNLIEAPPLGLLFFSRFNYLLFWLWFFGTSITNLKIKIHANCILSFWYICPNTNHLRKEDKRKLKINQGPHPS